MANILQFLKKKPAAASAPEPVADPVASADFVPYQCHFDAHTLLTKNGELMQIVKIAGNLRGRKLQLFALHPSPFVGEGCR